MSDSEESNYHGQSSSATLLVTGSYPTWIYSGFKFFGSIRIPRLHSFRDRLAIIRLRDSNIILCDLFWLRRIGSFVDTETGPPWNRTFQLKDEILWDFIQDGDSPNYLSTHCWRYFSILGSSIFEKLSQSLSKLEWNSWKSQVCLDRKNKKASRVD